MWQVGAIRIARIGGIAVEVHFTFIFVVAWGAWQGWIQYGGSIGAAYGMLVLGLLFVCILLHELGHGLQARAFGLVVRRITLLPIGGLAQLETPPAYPWHELLIALAGPLVNLILAILLGIVSYTIQPFTLATWVDQSLLIFFSPPSAASLVLYLVGANLILFVFNMLPAFPMDGGRVLRAGLALVLDYELATRIAAWLGRTMALVMGLLGLVGWPPAGIPPNPLLLVLAFMVFFGARHEEIYVRRQRALVRVEVRQIAQHGVETVAPWDTVTGNLVARLFRHDRTLPVVIEDKLVGLLTYQDIHRVRRQRGAVTVAHVMRTYFPVLNLNDTLWVALQEMHAFQLAALPVIDNGIFHGLVSLDDINHAWRFAARRGRRGGPSLVSGDSVPQ